MGELNYSQGLGESVAELFSVLVDKPNTAVLKQLSNFGREYDKELRKFLDSYTLKTTSEECGAITALALSSAKSERKQIKTLVSLATNDLSDEYLTSYCVGIVRGLSYENKIAM